MKTMILRDAGRAVTEIAHEHKTYRPNKAGKFEVEDGHVEALRAHGLKLEGEIDAAAKSALADKDAEIVALKKRVAELEGEPKGKK